MATVTNMMTYPSSGEVADVAVALMVRHTWHGQTVSPGSRVLLPPLLAQPMVLDLPHASGDFSHHQGMTYTS